MSRASQLLLCVLVACCSCCCWCPSPAEASTLADSVRPLYNATDGFLDLIQPVEKRSFVLQDLLPALLGPGGSFTPPKSANDGLAYARAVLGFAILTCLGLLLTLLVPLTCCCVCCCRCCCRKCGGRVNYMERRGASCRRGVYGTCMLLFATAMLFGSVLAFISNQLLREQLRHQPQSASSGGLMGELSAGLTDIADTLEQVPERGRNATRAAVAAAVPLIRPSLNGTLARLQQDLSFSNATNAVGVLQAAEAALQRLATARQRLSNYSSGHAGYASSLTALNQTMAEVQANLTTPAGFVCPPGASPGDCATVNGSLDNLTLNQDPSSVGQDVANRLSSQLDQPNATAMQQQLTAARAALENMTTAGMELVDKHLENALNALNDSSQLMQLWSQIDPPIAEATSKLRQAGNMYLVNPIGNSNETVASAVSFFDAYRYYVYIGLGAFTLLLVALFYVGLLYGCAGEPPFEDAGCCNRGVGANFVLAGAALGCIFYGLLMLIVMLTFLIGGLTDTQVCRYLTGRAGPAGYRVLDEAASLGLDQLKLPPSLNVSSNVSALFPSPASALLSGCTANGANGSLSGAVDTNLLADWIQLASYVDSFLNQSMRQLADQGADFVSGASLNVSELYEVRRIAANASAVDFGPFESVLSQPLAQTNLSTLLTALKKIGNDTTDASAQAHFNSLHASLSASADAAAGQAASQLAALRHVSSALGQLNASAAELPERLSAADAALRSSDVLLKAIQTAADGLSELLLTVAKAQLGWVFGEAADCGQLGAGLRRVVRAPCVNVLQPFNGYWAGLGLCLLALLPCLVLAVKLANLYRKTQKYLPDFDEGNPKPV